MIQESCVTFACGSDQSIGPAQSQAQDRLQAPHPKTQRTKAPYQRKENCSCRTIMGLMDDQFGKNYQGGSSCPDTLQAFRNNQRSLSHEMLYRPLPSTRATVLVRVPRQGNGEPAF